MIRPLIAAGLTLLGLISPRQAEAAGDFTTLASLSTATGSKPTSGVVFDSSGNLYGVAATGGAYGLGSIFKLTPAGVLSDLHSFDGADGDPLLTQGNLAIDSSGNLYGSTYLGGATGLGTVYTISAAGVFQTLHTFSGSDGSGPEYGVTVDSQGNLYGTTQFAGMAGSGSIFKIAPGGVFSTVYLFPLAAGQSPTSGVTIDSAGNLYGSTSMAAGQGPGAVYKLTPGGVFSTLATFGGGALGVGVPSGNLALDAQGNLYGSTTNSNSQGAEFGFSGAIYKITAAGQLTTLRSYLAIFVDSLVAYGEVPTGCVTVDASGNVYGTTTLVYSLKESGGWAFAIPAAGGFSILHSFPAADLAPLPGLTLDASGNVYGTTLGGGTGSDGTVFEITVSAP